MEDEVKKKTELSRQSAQALKNGDLLHHKLIMKLVVKRLVEPDARFNGWVLDGFP